MVMKGRGTMNPHELLCKTNWDLIKGKLFSNEQKADITSFLLSSANPENTANRFPMMYPLFFVPPYNNGKKLITINGVMPKTNIFSANHYELEILRLLALWRSSDDAVQYMLHRTKERLSSACYGKFCSKGECFETSIVALRFMATVFPIEEEWIGRLTDGIRGEIDNKPRGKKRHSGTTFYYWLTLTDIDSSLATSEIKRYEPLLVHHLSRSCSYNLEYDKVYNPIAIYIIRNCLARLPEYHHIKDLEGYVGNDGRFHFDFSNAAGT